MWHGFLLLHSPSPSPLGPMTSLLRSCMVTDVTCRCAKSMRHGNWSSDHGPLISYDQQPWPRPWLDHLVIGSGCVMVILWLYFLFTTTSCFHHSWPPIECICSFWSLESDSQWQAGRFLGGFGGRWPWCCWWAGKLCTPYLGNQVTWKEWCGVWMNSGDSGSRKSSLGWDLIASMARIK